MFTKRNDAIVAAHHFCTYNGWIAKQRAHYNALE